MENLIFGAFATLDGYREGDAANLGRTVYDRCTVVALCSAKAQNPACTVALLTNAPVPEPFRSQLTQGGVEIWDCPFTTYRVPADTNWALAYYKLCAMAWVLENRNFARAAMLDLDTFTQRPLDDLWRECDEAVLLYQVPHAASQTMTAAISRCFDAVEPDGAPHTLTHFGGELVAGSRTRMTDFISLCRDYFEELQAKGITPREGDEAIWCGAAYRSLLAGKPVRAANAYIFRYWLGGHFLLCIDKLYTRPRLHPASAGCGEGPPAETDLQWLCQAWGFPAAEQNLPPVRPARRTSAAAAHRMDAAAGQAVRSCHVQKEK